MWLDLDIIRMMKFENASNFLDVRYASIQTPTYPCGQLGALIGLKAVEGKIENRSVKIPVREVREMKKKI